MSRLRLSRILIWSGSLLLVLSVAGVAVEGLATRQRQAEAEAANVVSRGERLELTLTSERGSDSAPETTPMIAPPQFATPPAEPSSTPEPAPTATPVPVASPTRVALATTVGPTPIPTLEPVVEPMLEENVSYGPALWVTIPRIKVDERVMEVGVENGEYVAPAWDIGHQDDSVNPGEPGNSVFNGHLTTINAGHVFARLHELRPGDAIYVFTKTHKLTWIVQHVYTTDNDDSSFIAPTQDTRITLYTCDGYLIPLEHDYSARFVVVGRLEEARVRDAASAGSDAAGG